MLVFYAIPSSTVSNRRGFYETDYIGDTPDQMPKFEEPEPQTVKCGMTTGFGLKKQTGYAIAYGYEPVSLCPSPIKLYEIADVAGITISMKENHIIFDEAYATETQRLQGAFDLHDQACLLWQEAKQKYQADMSKFR